MKTELLSPAGDLNRAKIALDFGADAVYLGAKAFSLRARASNFDLNEIKEICEYAHSKNKKVYIVTNILCHNNQINLYDNFLKDLVSHCHPDGLICADPYIIYESKKLFPNLEIHVSTQQSICNSYACHFFKNNGATRIVLARELSFQELKDLKKAIGNEIELEIFIHGAVCISYSGRCMMSNYFSFRDANVGGCAQSCRWEYRLFDDQKVYTNKFSMSAKDMSLMNHINDLLKLNLSSFKIEGRMKSEYYVACINHAYRLVIDNYYKNLQTDFNKINSDLKKVANRETSNAWFEGSPNDSKMLYHEILKQVSQVFAFVVNEKVRNFEYLVTTRNYISSAMTFEVISPNQPIRKFKILEIRNFDDLKVDFVNKPMSQCYIKLADNVELKKNDICRILSN